MTADRSHNDHPTATVSDATTKKTEANTATSESTELELTEDLLEKWGAFAAKFNLPQAGQPIRVSSLDTLRPKK